MIIGKSIKYDLVSDAAYKFERGVDICIQDFALRRFIKIVEDHVEIKSISIKSDFNQMIMNKDRLIGIILKLIIFLEQILNEKNIDKILSNLGFEINNNFIVPSWRHDIESVNDLAEEIARVIGYNNIPKNNLKF